MATARSLEKLLNDPDVTPATIISPRYYLEDASFLVALEEHAHFVGLLEKCAAALQSPKWPFFLGRKACVPTRPVMEALVESYDGIQDALERHPWSWLGVGMEARNAPRPEALTIIIDEPDGELLRQDAVRTNQARQYGFRHAHRYTVPTPVGGES